MVKKPTAAGDTEAEERRRLRSLAFSNGLLQRGEPAAPRSALAPSSAVARLQGRDIVRRGGQRKSRFLFSFPGLLAPAAAAASGGRVGELADLGSKNPVLYLEFPQGRMKLFGTHVYPKNKYLTLQMTRSAKGVACEDSFESLIVFSEAWWIGTKEGNPEELKLEFPKEFQNDGAAADCDFKGGAGSTSDDAINDIRSGKEITEPLSPKFESDGDASEDSDHMDENGTRTTSEPPSVRQSARTAGKKALNYTELSSGGDLADSDNEIEVPEDLDAKMKSTEVKKESQSEDIPGDSSVCSLSSKEPLVQATLSSMFRKAEEKKRSTRSPKGSPATKGPAAKKQRASPKEKKPAGKTKSSGARKKQKPKVEEDEIERLSSSSQDNIVDDDSDEDWAGKFPQCWIDRCGRVAEENSLSHERGGGRKEGKKTQRRHPPPHTRLTCDLQRKRGGSEFRPACVRSFKIDSADAPSPPLSPPLFLSAASEEIGGVCERRNSSPFCLPAQEQGSRQQLELPSVTGLGCQILNLAASPCPTPI